MKNHTFVLLLCFLVGTLPLLAQASKNTKVKPKKKSLLDVVSAQELPKLFLELDLKKLLDDRRMMNYQKALATITFDDGEVWTDNIRLRTRGVYRNRKCENPPLKLKYYKKSLKARKLNKNNELKLVYPCNGGSIYQKYVYKEYLVYKLNNVLTDNSLRVQLIDLEIKDSLDNIDPIFVKGFLMEHQEELIRRVGAVKSDVKCLDPIQLSEHDYILLQVFQFFIGNTDWLLKNCKNIELIRMESGATIPIAYDFDFSGMVNAEYAVPNSKFPLRTITDRYFLGHQKTMEELAPAFALFQEKKSVLIQTVEDFEYLSIKERKKMIKYMESFYRILDKPKLVKYHFMHSMAEKVKYDY